MTARTIAGFSAKRPGDSSERRHRGSPTARRHVRVHRAHRLRRAVGLTMTAALSFVGTGAAAYGIRQYTNIDTIEDLGDEGTRPPAATPTDPGVRAPQTFLLLGSDGRDGENQSIGGGDVEGMRSDTTMLLHVSADRTRGEVVSIPRDAKVDVPSCPVTGGGYTTARTGQRFNSAFDTGWRAGRDLDSAAACTRTTVESLTGIRIDGIVVADFAGFERMVDDLGGVPMCIPEDMDSTRADLHLTAGQQRLDGHDALALARARYGLSDGSDTYRMGRQQAVMAAFFQELRAQGTMTDLPALARFVDTATSSLTISEGIGIQDLAASLGSLSPEDVAFLTAPSEPVPGDEARVRFTPEAETVWAAIREDRPVAEALAPTDDPDAGTPETTGTTPPDAAPDAGTDPGADVEPVDPLADRRPGEIITSADTRSACD